MRIAAVWRAMVERAPPSARVRASQERTVRCVSVDATQPLFGMPVDDDHGVDALEPTQRRVWEALPRSAPASVEAICVAAALSREEVNYALMELSVAGLVAGTTRGWTRTGGGRP